MGTLKFSSTYFIATLAVLLIETLIALYINDAFIRPYVGDTLAVVLVYCFFKIGVRGHKTRLVLLSLAIAFCIEALQATNFIEYIGLEDYTFVKIVLGTSFSWGDMLAYIAGALLIFIFELGANGKSIRYLMKFRLIFFGFFSFYLLSCGHSKRKSDLITNYEQRSSEIMKVKRYFEQIVPEYYKVRIRYESSDAIDLVVYERLNDSSDNELLFRKWNININNYKEEPQSDYDKKYHGKTNSFELAKTKLNWSNL